MYEGAMSRYWMKDVIMCHGSNCSLRVQFLMSVCEARAERLTKINEAITYKPRVASNESTIFRKIGFVKTSPSVKPRPPPSAAVAAAIFSMPLKARRNAATYSTISLHERGE